MENLKSKQWANERSELIKVARALKEFNPETYAYLLHQVVSKEAYVAQQKLEKLKL